LVPTATKEQVPKVFHEPHVEKGFRVLGQPWSYYIYSVFQLHNESVNIWSHIVACVLTGVKLVSFWNEVCSFFVGLGRQTIFVNYVENQVECKLGELLIERRMLVEHATFS
jgi:predicted membrane channel-forming protein YqfA (hemolysin III family)